MKNRLLAVRRFSFGEIVVRSVERSLNAECRVHRSRETPCWCRVQVMPWPFSCLLEFRNHYQLHIWIQQVTAAVSPCGTSLNASPRLFPCARSHRRDGRLCYRRISFAVFGTFEKSLPTRDAHRISIAYDPDDRGVSGSNEKHICPRCIVREETIVFRRLDVRSVRETNTTNVTVPR